MWYSNTIPIIIFSIVGVIALVAIYYRMLSILFTLIASGIIAIWAGSYLGSTAGIIIFCVIFFPALKVAYIIDAGFGLYNNHRRKWCKGYKKRWKSIDYSKTNIRRTIANPKNIKTDKIPISIFWGSV